ncbi:hypothetical protein [Sedimenticola selenatireducens]|uniref:DUF5343 domain-containing protein n=1 Tax=Sedimenticola selenatireducens TaxID=191960 RepID=A0A558DJW6_9GAMM|nr:hypothetical protein [Sedimenticola selenatireducens]TVO72260.1 hypothetical protein FHP88_13345 [Sedimenticola selenatireducens]TVT61311.1 MAG: hypothetical protein FHK78_18140 [Sedimenticola selenatireducens]
MAKDKHNLPSSSLQELEKIIKGYCHASKDASLDDLANLLGMHKTAVSKNNPFLAELGVVQGGRKKTITDTGAKFGRAIEHNHTQDIQKYLSELVSASEFFAGLITTVRIKGGMSQEELTKHILYVSGQKTTKENKTGANTIIDLFEKGGLLLDKDGKLVISTTSASQTAKIEDEEKQPPLQQASEAIQAQQTPPPSVSPPAIQSPVITKNLTPTVNINIQLEIPESDNPEVYENLFKALRKHILDHDE